MTGFKKLENSLIDVIKEEQAKLGFKEEKIHLYYPLSSLNHFFSVQDSASWEMWRCLIKGTDSVFIFRSLEAFMCMRI